jgi:arginine/serine-rich splicing factor 4/5/6
MSARVYLGRLPRDAEQRDVEKLIGEFGRTKDIRLLTGYAFVEFEDSRDAKDACRELDNSRFMGERYTKLLKY